MNKKFLFMILFGIFLGAFLGHLFYKNYIEEQNLDNDYNSYLLQLGIYDTKEDMQKSLNNINNYMIIEKNNKFYVYLGISSKKENAAKIKDAFLEQNIELSIKQTVIDNIEFMSNLEQFDILLDSAVTSEDVMSINEVILSSYEEMVLFN